MNSTRFLTESGRRLGAGLLLAATAAALPQAPAEGPSAGQPAQVTAGATAGATAGERATLTESEVEFYSVSSSGAWGRFDPDAWALALRDTDLQKREAAFEGLVDRAACDPSAEGWLRVTSASSLDPELAWVARLALREMEQECVRTNPDRRAGVFATPSMVIERHWMDEWEDLLRRYQRLLGSVSPSLAMTPNGALILSPIGPGAFAMIGRPAAPHADVPAPGAVKHTERRVLLRVSRNSESEPTRAAQKDAERARLLREVGLRMDLLGVRLSELPAERASALKLAPGEGVVIEQVLPSTLAWFLGLEASDVVTEINGQVVGRPEDLTRILRERGAGAPLEVHWIDSAGKRRTGRWKAIEVVTPESDVDGGMAGD